MINVYKSDTGQYVLVHPPSNSVIIDDDLTEAFDRISEHAGEPEPFEPSAQESGARRRSTTWMLFAALALLPFLWLLALHYTLGSVATELIGRDRPGVERLESLELELERLRTEVSLLANAVADQGIEPPSSAEPSSDDAKPGRSERR